MEPISERVDSIVWRRGVLGKPVTEWIDGIVWGCSQTIQPISEWINGIVRQGAIIAAVQRIPIPIVGHIAVPMRMVRIGATMINRGVLVMEMVVTEMPCVVVMKTVMSVVEGVMPGCVVITPGSSRTRRPSQSQA
jgi:hypothetical protein